MFAQSGDAVSSLVNCGAHECRTTCTQDIRRLIPYHSLGCITWAGLTHCGAPIESPQTPLPPGSPTRNYISITHLFFQIFFQKKFNRCLDYFQWQCSFKRRRCYIFVPHTTFWEEFRSSKCKTLTPETGVCILNPALGCGFG